MKHTKLLVCALTLALLAVCAGILLAQCGSGGCGAAAPAAKSSTETSPAKAPVLSAAQNAKIAQIEKTRQAKIADVQSKFSQARKQISSLSADFKASDATVTGKIKEAMGYQAQIVAANVIAQRQKDRIFTPAQPKPAAMAQDGRGYGASKPATSGGGCGSGGSCGSAKPAASDGGCGSGCGAEARAASKPAASGGCGSGCGG